MSNIKRIGEDNYVKQPGSKHDELNEDSEKIIETLKDHIRVPYELLNDVIPGTRIKYITEDGLFRTGGILTKNGFPNYFVLLNPYKKITWSVNLKKNNIFMEDMRKKQKEKAEKDNLHKLYKAGMLRIKDDEEED